MFFGKYAILFLVALASGLFCVPDRALAKDNPMLRMAELESLVNIPGAAASEGSNARVLRAFTENDFSSCEKELITLLYGLFAGPRGKKSVEAVTAKIDRLYPRTPELWILIGRELRRLNDSDGAVESFRQSLKIDPDCKTAKEEIGTQLPVKTIRKMTESVKVTDAARFEELINMSLSAADARDRALLKSCNLHGKEEALVNALYDLFLEQAGKARVVKHRPQILRIYPHSPDLWKVLRKTLEMTGDRAGATVCD